MLLIRLLLLGLVLAAPRPDTTEGFLEENGLGDLTARFQEEDITIVVLPMLNDGDLQEFGLIIGRSQCFMAAINLFISQARLV